MEQKKKLSELDTRFRSREFGVFVFCFAVFSTNLIRHSNCMPMSTRLIAKGFSAKKMTSTFDTV